jgi:hypothetical protein
MLFRTFAVYIKLNRMEPDFLSSKQRAAISSAFSYWLEHWDWEMATLTGQTLEEFQRAAEVWRWPAAKVQQAFVLAALGAVRECWAQVGKASELLGMGQQEAQALVMLLAKEVDNAA